MSNGKGPEARCKAKFADGREQTSKMRDGSTRTNARREVFTVWDNGGGKYGIRFDADIQAAIVKALGGSASDRVYFDLFVEPGGFGAGDGGPSDAGGNDDF